MSNCCVCCGCGTGSGRDRFCLNGSKKNLSRNRTGTGVTLLELILVLVIIAIGASLAVPKLRKSVENREAKAVLETLRSISHAVRMFEVTKGRLPTDLPELETTTTGDPGTETSYGTFYLDPCEYQENVNCGHSNGWTYSITNVPPVVMTAAHSNSRTITLTQCVNIKGKDGAVDDNKDFLDFTPEPGTC